MGKSQNKPDDDYINEFKNMTPEEEEKLIREFEAQMLQYEEDKKKHDFSVPKEWEDDFKAVMDKVLIDRQREKRRNRRILAACAVIALLMTSNIFTKVTYGTNIPEYFRNQITWNKWENSTKSTDEVTAGLTTDLDQSDIHYEVESMDEVFQMVRDDLKFQILALDNLAEEYTIQEANLNKDFMVLRIKIAVPEGLCYLTEEFNYAETASGNMAEKELVSTIYNDNLKRNIDIYDTTDNMKYNGYFFEIEYDHLYFYYEGIGTLEEFETLAQSIYLK